MSQESENDSAICIESENMTSTTEDMSTDNLHSAQTPPATSSRPESIMETEGREDSGDPELLPDAGDALQEAGRTEEKLTADEGAAGDAPWNAQRPAPEAQSPEEEQQPQETAGEAMDTEEPESQAPAEEGTYQSLRDAGDDLGAEQPQTLDQENVDEGSVNAKDLTEDRWRQGSAAAEMVEEESMEAGDGAAPCSSEVEQEVSALADGGPQGDDLTMSVEDEDKLLAENNQPVSSVQGDSEHSSAVGKASDESSVIAVDELETDIFRGQDTHENSSAVGPASDESSVIAVDELETDTSREQETQENSSAVGPSFDESNVINVDELETDTSREQETQSVENNEENESGSIEEMDVTSKAAEAVENNSEVTGDSPGGAEENQEKDNSPAVEEDSDAVQEVGIIDSQDIEYPTKEELDTHVTTMHKAQDVTQAVAAESGQASSTTTGEAAEEGAMLQVTEVKSMADSIDITQEEDSGYPNWTGKAEADASTAAAATWKEVKFQPAKSIAVVDDDDDDDDVVVLDDLEVAPMKVKQESSSGKEVLTNSNDMGIQIASVSGGVEELHKMAQLNDVKQENGGDVKSPFTQPSLKMSPAVPNTPPAVSSAAEKKTPAKIQSCIVCRRLGKCKYNIVRNGDVKHLCDDACFKRFRSNPSVYLKGTTSKVSDSPAAPRARPAKSASQLIVGQPPPAKPAPVSLKTCVVCQIMNINNQGQFCVWKGMDFCGEGCLGKFQSGISTTCTLCKSFIPLTARSSNCLRLGNQIRPFCSVRCFTDYKVWVRLCTFCHGDLSQRPQDSLVSNADEGSGREFCSQRCMRKFQGTLSTQVEIMPVEHSKQRAASKCSVCQKMEKIKHAVKFSGVVHNLCSDPCLSAFRYANKLDMKTCDYCSTLCSSLETSPHVVVFEGDRKRFCSDACVSRYRTAKRKTVACSWCGSKRDNFDMIERLDSNNKYQLFCSLNCLSLFRVNLQTEQRYECGQAKSNQAVTCDLCHKMTPAQYHLTMSDASVRNFCCYTCVMSFQSYFSKGTTPPPPPSPTTPTPTPTPLSTSTHKHNTRGKTKSVASPAITTSIPIISNVISLAPQGSQTVNIKNSTGAPVVVSGTGPATKSTGVGSGQQQHVIIQPPPPKVVKNKSLMCRPFTQTKATSCRPHSQSKECQTDEVREKPVIVPVPVPVYLPTPMALYSAPAPTPIFIPIPIPIPVFIPTTRKSASSIMKHIKEIMDRTPSDPLEAELLQMAAAVSGDGKNDDADSDSEEDALPEVTKSRKRPLMMDNDDDDDDRDGDVSPLTNEKEDGEEDMLSMALRMAEEITDLESAVEAVPVATEASALVDGSRVIAEPVPEEDFRIRRATRRSARGPAKAKRPRLQQDSASGDDQPAQPQEAAAPPPDFNCHLKFTYGVNAWRHWVMFKNAQIEKNRKPESGGRGKLFKTDILQCTAEELNFSLCLFVKEVRKPNGEEYSPDSIYYLTLGLQQFLYENGRIDNLFADHYYEPFNQRLAEILVTCQPKFNSAGQMVCRIEEEHLWECKQLGAHSPYVLLNTLIYFHTKFFMLKTPEDHLQLSFAHILKYWKKGGNQPPPKGGQPPRSVSLRYYSVSSARKDASATISTTKRGSRDGIPVFEVVENQDNPLRCPVKLYEFFLSKCPESIKNRSDIFYPVPERSCVPDSPVWYSTLPLTEDVMTRMLTRILLVREIQEAHLHARPIFV